MTSKEEETRQTIVKLVQMLLLSENDPSSITPALINTKIDFVLTMQAAWGEGLDRTAVTDELIRRFSLWIGTDATMSNEVGHIAWLTAARRENWRYWQRYSEWLERNLSFKAVEALDQSTDRVLGLLEDPRREGKWDRRGMVVGHVQSGKTSHYSALINKAADAGYKIIIVLAGMHNNLRSQTQVRLDEAFLGYETSPLEKDLAVIGVGKVDADPTIRPNYATNRSDRGDFSTAAAKNLGISPEQRPWLFVVKKHKGILERLLLWIRNHVTNSLDETGRKVVTNLPLLMIDDEADHASVDTGEQSFDADGNPDPDHDPKPINSAIRRILASFTRRAYVGYTATPFANIFIHNRAQTAEEGADLFPSAFITNLGAPSNYIGPSRVFGYAGTQERQGGLPLVRIIEDHVDKEGSGGWMPPKHKNGHIPVHDGTQVIPPSLVDAIDTFVLASAVRRLRGQATQHCSMLIHVTRFTNVQEEVRRQVEDHVRLLRQKITRRVSHEPELRRLQAAFENDFLPTTDAVRVARPDWVTYEDVEWTQVEAVLAETLADIDVRTINGTAKDALDYVENAATGLKVIAIGGDKLSRGLTLEGLCVSYFLRASKMYDTLMQMGRWFGYRPGYVDLCRLFMTEDLEEWFGHITDAAEELREEFDMMVETGATPDEYGLKVASHPVLLVTSPLKMRAATTLMLSFSGQVLETVAFYNTRAELQKNVDSTRRFLQGIGNNPIPIPDKVRTDDRQDRWTGWMWEHVEADQVVAFLLSYLTHPAARKVNSAMLAQFINSMAETGELTDWTVVLIGGTDGRKEEIALGFPLGMNKRAGDKVKTDRYSIGRLLDPKDEGVDLDLKEWSAALTETQTRQKPDPGRNKERKRPEVPSGPAMRRVRGLGAPGVQAHPERGLLILYALDPREAGTGFPGESVEDIPPVIAFGISFPESKTMKTVPYKANNVLVEQWAMEYGPAD